MFCCTVQKRQANVRTTCACGVGIVADRRLGDVEPRAA